MKLKPVFIFTKDDTMKKIFAILLCISTMLGFTACGNAAEQTDDGKISVVATIFPEYDFARAISGGLADIKMLVSPATEIHSYEPSPQDIVAVQNADLFIYIGGEGDAWVEKILSAVDTSKMKILKMMDTVSVVEEEIVDGMEAESDSDEIEYDEHIWTSPKNAITMVNAICGAMSEIDSENTAAYSANAAAYSAEIQAVDDEIKQVVDSASKKMLVFGDRFPFRYFADEFGLSYYAAFPGCSGETDASAATIAKLVTRIEENSLPAVFYVELSNHAMADSIANQTGTKALMLHSCHNVSKDDFDNSVTYVDLMKNNAESLRQGLPQ